MLRLDGQDVGHLLRHPRVNVCGIHVGHAAADVGEAEMQVVLRHDEGLVVHHDHLEGATAEV